MHEASVGSTGRKTCTKCGTAKPKAEFNRHKAGKEGLHPACKACRKAAGMTWRAANQEKERARGTAYRAANREKERMRGATYRATNLGKRLAACATYRAANPEKVSAANEAWRKANPERQRAAIETWRKANPDICRTYCQNRRARKKANGGKLSPDIVEIKMLEQNGTCPCCDAPLTEWHIDHSVPLSRGGTNTDDNVQLLLPGCNLRKGTKTMDEYMQYLYKKAA